MTVPTEPATPPDAPAAAGKAAFEGRVAAARDRYNAGDKREVLLEARALAAEDPRSFAAWALWTETEAWFGNAGAVLQALEVAAFTPDRRRRLGEAAVARAAKSGAFACALELARALAAPSSPPAEQLAQIAKAARRASEVEALEAEAARAPESPERALLSLDLAARRYDLAAAEAALAGVPPDHPERRDAARRIYDLAYDLHDHGAAHRAGMELLPKAGADVQLAFVVARAAASVGAMDDARAAFARADASAAALRADPARFTERWRQVANFAFDMLDIEAGQADLARARAEGLPRADAILGREAFDAFIAEFAEDLAWSRETARALIAGERPEFPADELVRVAARPKLFNPANPNALGAQMSWLRLVGETYRQARAAGGRACLVPLYLAAQAEAVRPARFTLSYHTTGERRAVAHFKEADLPSYMCLDRRGYAGWSRLADRTAADLPLDGLPEADAERFHAQFEAQVLARNVSKYVQPDPDPAAPPLPARYVFVALQIPTDRVQALGFVPATRMLEIVARRFAGTGVAVVAKRHPLCRDARMAEALERLAAEGLIEVRADGVHALIAGAQAVVTINSGVGSEALAHLKPVYLFGRADYAAACHVVRDADAFLAATSPIRPALDAPALKRFLLYYRKLFLVDTQRPDALAKAVAARVIVPALAEPPPGARSLKDEVDDLVRRESWPEAIAAAEAALAEAPASPRYLTALAAGLIGEARLDEAVAALAAARQADPAHLASVKQLLALAARETDPGPAAAQSDAAGGDPGFAARLALIRIRGGLAAEGEAASVLTRPQAPAVRALVRARLAFALEDAGRGEEAHALFDPALDPTEPAPDRALALARHQAAAVRYDLRAWRRLEAASAPGARHRRLGASLRLRHLWRYAGPTPALLALAAELAELFEAGQPGDAGFHLDRASLLLQAGAAKEAAALLAGHPALAAGAAAAPAVAALVRDTAAVAPSPEVLAAAGLFDALVAGTAALAARLADPAVRVAVVGNGPSVLGRGAGRAIDGHDLVVRFNRFEIADGFAGDCGRRTDLVVRARGDGDLGRVPPGVGVAYAYPSLPWLNRKWRAVAALHAAGAPLAALPEAVTSSLALKLRAPPSTGLAFLGWLQRLRGPLARGSVFGFGFTDQVGEGAGPSHYFDAAPPSRLHDWPAEKALFDGLFGG